MPNKCRIRRRWLGALLLFVAIGCASGRTREDAPEAQEWIQLFNGRDLEGWSARSPGSGSEAFRVEDGLLRVRRGETSQLLYKRRGFSHCVIAVEYRFLDRGGEEWMREEATVLGDSVVGAERRVVREKGYVGIRADSVAMEFRKIELLNLEGCMDREALTYKSYYVKADSTACFYAAPKP